ncbi:MAG: molybdenum cofactor guanylyltransferase MobA [Robiginitomaculum sp.]|nr:MAG: molybdenum cofactor guanylyltransferase MobA [Robiginitomaculum sp.]
MQAELPRNISDKLPCMVLCAGTSGRFGRDKMLADLGGKPMLAHLLDRLRSQTGSLAINANRIAEYQGFGLPVIKDCLEGSLGPLVGILSALLWAKEQGFEHILTCAGDTPFIPEDWVKRLQARAGEGPEERLEQRPEQRIIVSQSQGRAHYVCALWPVHMAEQLRSDIQNGWRGVGKWIASQPNTHVGFESSGDFDPFFNINTQADLELAEHILRP